LLVGPASQAYHQVDTWQDLASIARAIEHDSADQPLILFAPDETTRAMIDMYARTSVNLIPGPIDAAAIGRLRAQTAAAPRTLVVVQLPGRASAIAQRLGQHFGLHLNRAAPAGDAASELPWLPSAGLRVAKLYALPNGRRYVLLEVSPAAATHADARAARGTGIRT
jgi:hypothetical protein